MIMINHVTYHVPPGTLADADLEPFMYALGFRERVPDDPFEHGWKVRWFESRGPQVSPMIHLVEGDNEEAGVNANRDRDQLSLGHFCIRISPPNAGRLEMLRETDWCVRDSGSGRIWCGFANLRVEVRP